MTSAENTLPRNRVSRRKRSLLGRKKKAIRSVASSRGRPKMIARNPSLKSNIANATRRAGLPINLKIAAEGAEIKLPALPQFHVGWRSISAIAAVWLFAMLLMAFSSSSLAIMQLEIEGAQRISYQDINSLLALSGQSIFSIVPENLEKIIIEAYPELDGVSLRIALPARVLINIQERSPVLAWQQSGITVWVDEAGIAFIPQGDLENIPIVAAIEPPPNLLGDEFHRHQIISPQLVRTIKVLSALAPEDVVLLYDPQLGIGWQDPSGWQAFFGISSEHMEQRLAIYQSILGELAGRGLTPSLVSVAHLHAPYFRIDY